MNNYKSYYLKSLGLHEDFLPDEDEEEKKKKKFDPDELEKGTDAEQDSTEDPALADKIAKDNLGDDPEHYSKISQGMGNDSPEAPKSQPPMLNKLLSPHARSHPICVGAAVFGTKTGLLPAGGIVSNPEKARLGGLEIVKNLKPNSQGAISDTPASPQIQAKGGHFTPNSPAITVAQAPLTSVPGNSQMHPLQMQKLGNPPLNDDGTEHTGEESPPAATAGIEGGQAPRPEDKPSDADLKAAERRDDEDGVKKIWGIPLEGEKEDDEHYDIDIHENYDGMEECEYEMDEIFFSKQQEPTVDQIRDRIGDYLPHGQFPALKPRWVYDITDEQMKGVYLLSKAGFKIIGSFKGREAKKDQMAWLRQAVPDMPPHNPGIEDPITKYGNRAPSLVVGKKTDKILGFPLGEHDDIYGILRPDGTIKGKPVKDWLAKRKFQPKRIRNKIKGMEPSIYERFKKLANIPSCNSCGPGIPDQVKHQTHEAGLTSEQLNELRELVGRLQKNGKNSPMMEKAVRYLAEIDKPKTQ